MGHRVVERFGIVLTEEARYQFAARLDTANFSNTAFT